MSDIKDNSCYLTNDNGFYLTLVDDELRPIRCIKDDYTRNFIEGEIYLYKAYKHNETGTDVYAVYESPNTAKYFTKKSLSFFFDTIDIIRDEKLKSLGI